MEIEKVLLKLIELQDEITHYKVKGIKYTVDTQDLIKERDMLRRGITDYVKGLEKRGRYS
uniref:Uncharacterized protein n=1 Tax=viral metagenome TaxID=1070528 RepID=A0A6M3XM10_9ZZZZ